jgi:uncharacterized protein (DUF697 family)
MHRFDFGRVVDDALRTATLERGHVNLLVIGRRGAGVRRLIETTLQGHIAAAGEWTASTEGTGRLRQEGVPLTVLETLPLEETDLGELRRMVEKRQAMRAAREHIHAAWVCIAETQRSVGAPEVVATSMLAAYMPVLAVITEARLDEEFQSEVRRWLPAVSDVLRVRALPLELPDGRWLEPMGAAELAQKTADLLPDKAQYAFAASQKTNVALKARLSHGIVGAAAAATAGLALAPLPVADSLAMLPVLIGMLGGISVAFGIPIGEGFLRTVAASTLGGTLASLTFGAGGDLLKLAPIAGTAAGGFVSASSAAAVTTAFGEAYILVLEKYVKKGQVPTAEEVVKGLRETLDARRR